MADLSELQQALINADKAGDKDAATALAAEIQRVQGDTNANSLAKAGPVERFNMMASTPGGAAVYSPQGARRAAGLEKQGNTVEDIRNAIDSAGYRAGGAVTDLTGSPGLGYATNVAVEAVPALLGGEAMKATAAPKIVDASRRLMQSALKPSTADLLSGKADKAVNTMLEGGYNVSRSGVDAIKSKIGTINDEIGSMLEGHTDTIDLHKIADRAQELADRLKKQVNPNADVAAVKDAINEFLNHPLLKDTGSVPVQLAQEMKTGTYRAIGGKNYGELKSASVEAQKALARGLKEELEKAVPGIGAKNAEEGALINAANIAERRALLQDNTNLGGLVYMTHDPIAAAGYMADKLPIVKSAAANALYRGADPLSGVMGQASGGLLGSFVSQEPDDGILKKRTAWIGSGQGAK